jgi:hypothetical protein
MTTMALETTDWIIGIDRGSDDETVIIPQLIDGMQRQIHEGDIISWRSGGYFCHYLCFGLVLSVNPERENIRVINHRGNKVTIWRTYLAVILAREGDYSSISNEYLEKFGVSTE